MKRPKGEYMTMRMLAPTLHFDSQLVVEMSGKLESFAAIRAEVLLLGGSRSPAYLKAGVDSLRRVLPNAQRIEFPGSDTRRPGTATEAASLSRWQKRSADSSPDRKSTTGEYGYLILLVRVLYGCLPGQLQLNEKSPPPTGAGPAQCVDGQNYLL